MKDWPLVYLGLGGNIGDTPLVFRQVLKRISSMGSVQEFRSSKFYRTSPVGPIPQDYFTNAVCSFRTSLSPRDLFLQLEEIEKEFGKVAKSKEAPRVIDLDILLYGSQAYQDGDIQIPHLRWQERLFVLIPLKELADEVEVPQPDGNVLSIKLSDLLDQFPNTHNEAVCLQKADHATSSC